jgi:hypothetical protein
VRSLALSPDGNELAVHTTWSDGNGWGDVRSSEVRRWNIPDNRLLDPVAVDRSTNFLLYENATILRTTTPALNVDRLHTLDGGEQTDGTRETRPSWNNGGRADTAPGHLGLSLSIEDGQVYIHSVDPQKAPSRLEPGPDGLEYRK